MRAKDWAATPLGSPEAWPRSLRTVVRILLTSRYAMWMGWGPDLLFFYNDAYRPTLGTKHPWALGRPAREVWAEVWTDIESRVATVFQRGEATWDEALRLFLQRSGYAEETYHTFSYSPLSDDQDQIGGLFCVVTEETDRVISQRRLALLRLLATQLSATTTRGGVHDAIERSLEAEPHDIPFSLTYVFEEQNQRARLALADRPRGGASVRTGGHRSVGWRRGLAAAEDPAARVVGARADARHRLPVAVRPLGHPRDAVGGDPDRPSWTTGRGGRLHRRPQSISGVRRKLPQLSEPVRAVRLRPASPMRSAYEEERRRAEALAELDRAKTAFFSNVSHEFRTPLTLMLGPLEDLRVDAGCRRRSASRSTLVHRNALRLLKLVNTLLDFSRIEAGRDAGDLRADRSRQLHGGSGERLPLGDARGRACSSSSMLRRWASRSSSTATCGRRSSSTSSRTRSSSRSRGRSR